MTKKGPRAAFAAGAVVGSIAALLATSAVDALAEPVRVIKAGRLENAIVASVDGEPITLRDLQRYEAGRAKLLPPEQRRTREKTLEALVSEAMFEKEFEREGIAAADADVDSYIERILQQSGSTRDDVGQALSKIGLGWEDYFERMRREVQRLALINRVIRSRVNVTPQEVERYWETSDEFKTPDQVAISHIFIPYNHDLTPVERELVKRRAEEAHEEARSRGFSAAAKKYSSGPTAEDGGALGTFRRGSMALLFEREVAKLGKGDISEPFEADGAYHLIAVTDVLPPGRVPLDEVEAGIREKLYNDRLEERFTRWTRTDLRKRYHVTVHYDRVASLM